VTDLSSLRDADTDAARAFLTEIGAEDLVAAIRATSDDDLLSVVGRDEIRPVAVEVILSRLHEYAVTERLVLLHGVVRFDLQRRGRLLERHGLELRGGEILARPDIAADERVDVVLTTNVVRFLRLVSGERNAGLDYLAGTLDIRGDAALAIALGGIFRVPGTHQVAMDPAELDPVEVATVLRTVPLRRLRDVMASGFRSVVLDEIFRRLPEFLNERKARDVDLTVGFRLLGNPSGEIERYVVRVRDGVARVDAGVAGEPRDATVTCEGYDYLRVATGQLSPVIGVLKGQLKVRGDKGKALQLSSLLEIPAAR
jgi:putative sterol carrier protein